MMRRFVFLVLFSTIGHGLYAQESDKVRFIDRLNDKEINFLDNVFTGTANPAALSFNTVHTFTRATVNTHFKRGDFHVIDGSSRYNDFSVDIFGLKRIGKLSLSGDLSYINSKAFDHRWNNTALMTQQNPFVLADSVASDVNQESFSMYAGASLKMTEKLFTALKLQFVTTSLSDQTDPRPKTNAMRFEAKPGVVWRMNERNNLGFSTNIGIYRSSISHTIVNNLVNNTYFLMKGMGDNAQFTSSDALSYPRDYRGTSFSGSAQWNTKLGTFDNLIEASFSANSEIAEDGGAAYTFKGGDYSANQIAVYDRFSFNTSDVLTHQLMVRTAYIFDKGYWYDQRRTVDTQHANRVYYEILNKSEVQNSTYTQADLEYRIDKRHHEDAPIWTASVNGGVVNQQTTHYEADVYKQKFNTIHAGIDFTRRWNLKPCYIVAALGAHYAAPLGTPVYNSVRGKLEDTFSRPVFEYSTASRVGFNTRLSVSLPLRIYSTASWLSLYAQSRHTFYTGSNRFSAFYNGTTRSIIDAGLSLTL